VAYWLARRPNLREIVGSIPGMSFLRTPSHPKKNRISFDFQLPNFDVASYSFQTVMVPVPGQNLEICSASTCNTRQKERKLGFYRRKVY
jgi:hypothetical protein